MASVTKRGDGWRVRWRGPDGRERQQTFDSHARAKVHASRVDVDLASGSYIDPTEAAVTFDEWWRMRTDGRTDVKPQTLVRVRGALRKASEHIGHVPLSKLRPSMIQDMIDALNADGLSPRYVAHVVRTTSTILREAQRDRRITANPCERARLPRPAEGEMGVLTPAEVEAVASAAGEHWRLMIQMAAYTGLRQGELWGLRVADLDLLRRRVLVRRTWVAENRADETLKTPGSRRDVPLVGWLADALADRIADMAPDDVLWRTVRGARIEPGHWRRRVWYPALATAGIDRQVTPHALRHSCASWMISEGANVVKVSKWLGHAKVSTTLDTYSHLMPDDLDGVAEALGGMRVEPEPMGEVEEL